MKILIVHTPPVQVQPPPTVHIALSLQEAEILRCFVGGVGVSTSRTAPADRLVADLYDKLTDSGVGNGSNQSYSDFFAGEPRTK